jgi:hypothetical protein
MPPLGRYVELTAGVYDRIASDTHDPHPVREGSLDPLSADGIAAEEGCFSHGNHWDCPDGVYYEEDLLALRGLDGRNPLTRFPNRRLSDLAFGARANTTFEFGLDWSLDAGVSGIYQRGHKRSQRYDRRGNSLDSAHVPDDGMRHSKGLFGMDATFFWHPLAWGGARGIDFGIEALANREGFEEPRPGGVRTCDLTRAGAFGHARYRHSPRWHFGGFAEAFQEREGSTPCADETPLLKRRAGAFVTLNLSHFQYLRLEASRYENMTRDADPVHRIVLQYDAVIGYHTHGVQR